MDMNILNGFVVFLPVVLALYFIIAKIKLSLVNKNFLSYSPVAASFLGFIYFIIQYFLFKENLDIFNFEFCNFNNFSINFNNIISFNSLKLLILSNFSFLLFSIFINFYFKKKKQFMFIKQRYITFLLLLTGLNNIFICANDLFFMFFILLIIGLVVFLFCYYDIFKNCSKTNILRFFRVNILGDFCFLAALLLLFKHSSILEYLNLSNFSFEDFDVFVDYLFSIANIIEFKTIFILLLLSATTRFIIFPFSTYYTFLSNVSNLVFVPIVIINLFLGYKILFLTTSFYSFLANSSIILNIILLISLIFSVISLFFEKNIKIIFGYFIIILNSLTMFFYVNHRILNFNIIFYIPYLIAFLTILYCIYKEKNNFSRRIIDKQKGFYLERINILIFENFTDFLGKIFSFVDEKIIQKILFFPYEIINILISYIVFKLSKINKFDILKYIFIIFVIFILSAIIIALFKGGKC